jgi:hypothetical protein
MKSVTDIQELPINWPYGGGDKRPNREYMSQ